MKSSIGQDSLAERVDADKDGVADQAEEAFEETSKSPPQPASGSRSEDDAQAQPQPSRLSYRA